MSCPHQRTATTNKAKPKAPSHAAKVKKIKLKTMLWIKQIFNHARKANKDKLKASKVNKVPRRCFRPETNTNNKIDEEEMKQIELIEKISCLYGVNKHVGLVSQSWGFSKGFRRTTNLYLKLPKLKSLIRLSSDIISHILLLLFLSLSLLFLVLTHPLAIGLNLLGITLLLAIRLSLLSAYSWLSYSLILVLLGGLLVIFVYISLVARNDLFSSPNFLNLFIFLVPFLGIVIILNQNDLVFSENESELFFESKRSEGLEWISDLYAFSIENITIFLVIYLFLTLLVVVSITKRNKMTLRSL